MKRFCVCRLFLALLAGVTGCGDGEGLVPDPIAVGQRVGALSGPGLGDPLPGLTDEQLALFFEGERQFEHEFTPREGLGPVFIERSCVACHALGGIGGADRGTNENHFIERFAIANKVSTPPTYDPLATLGGDVRQTRSIAGMRTTCNVAPESVPPSANNVVDRSSLQIFGAGLMDAIPDATILAGQRPAPDADGVQGVANLVEAVPGRFGWKAQNVNIQTFTAGAAAGTLSLTTSLIGAEQRPQGVDPGTIPGCSAASLGTTSPNDQDDAFLFPVTAWEVLLAPPSPRPLEGAARRGAQVFSEIGCAKCHTPRMTIPGDRNYVLTIGTRALSVPQLNGMEAALYSDLLIHRMGAPGSEADEGVIVRIAFGNFFRTPPLWGVGHRKRFLHDGRARSLDEAVRKHDGEARIIRNRYVSLPERKREEVLSFLKSL